jgi:hypothetical protein
MYSPALCSIPPTRLCAVPLRRAPKRGRSRLPKPFRYESLRLSPSRQCANRRAPACLRQGDHAGARIVVIRAEAHPAPLLNDRQIARQGGPFDPKDLCQTADRDRSAFVQSDQYRKLRRAQAVRSQRMIEMARNRACRAAGSEAEAFCAFGKRAIVHKKSVYALNNENKTSFRPACRSEERATG